MRGRRGRSSSPVIQLQARMALRKQTAKDAAGIPSESHRIDANTQEDDAVDDRDDTDEFSLSLLPATSTRDKRRRDRQNKSKPKEMTEDEMMDLALRLSEQEANVTASRMQQEEAAVMKAIQESMVGQTQLCPPSQSQSDGEASLRLCPRRKLLYSNRKGTSAVDQGALAHGCPPETYLNQEADQTRDENNEQNKKRKKKEGSPLPEMPDLSQTQNIYSQASPCSSKSLSLPLDSPESSDSTQIDDYQLHKSPVFPSTGCRPTVHIPRLSQDLLEACKTSGFVLCSQDSSTSTQKSMLVQPKSPTFVNSPSNITSRPKSPIFSEADRDDDGVIEMSPKRGRSPVFGQSTQHERYPSACKPQVCENSGFMFSSQDSLTSTVRSTSCRPKSPVFPRSPGLSKNLSPLEGSSVCRSPVFSETEREHTEQSQDTSASLVFGKTGRPQTIHPDVKKKSLVPSDGELRGSSSEVNSLSITGPCESLSQDRKTDHNQDGRYNKRTSSKSDDAPELIEISKHNNRAETQLSSDMTLCWSDEDDDDLTPVGSPSPVFPEERSVHQTDSGDASLNHVTAAVAETTVSNCRQQLSATEQKQPVNSQRTANKASAPTGDCEEGPTIHYYWGVPFCPRGLNPDSYTQVILAQMEVYEKSLKQAQRCLLRKAEWGEPILPQPEMSPSPESPGESLQPQVPQRHGLRLRGKKHREAAESSPAEAEDEEDKKEEEEKDTERENKEEEKNEGGDGEEDTDDCEVCPETQLSDNDSTQDLPMAPDVRAQLRPGRSELPEVEMILQDSSAVDQQEVEEQMEVDTPLDGKTQRSIPVCGNFGGQNVRKDKMEEDKEDPDVEVVKDQELPRSASPELEPAVVPQSPVTSVDCPICQGSFPVTEIEIHAAYCDGEVAVVDERRPELNSFQASLKPHRKRKRRADVTDEETNSHSNTGRGQEKCYVCQKTVPLEDYVHHTDLCFQRRAPKNDTRGTLLSALEQTESRDSDAGPSKLQSEDVIDLRDDDEDEDDDGVSALRISNSPIRSFTPISEATDCLIDFRKQQRAKKPSRRRR